MTRRARITIGVLLIAALIATVAILGGHSQSGAPIAAAAPSSNPAASPADSDSPVVALADVPSQRADATTAPAGVTDPPAVADPVAAVPLRKAATAALRIITSARLDTAFVGPGFHATLLANLITLQNISHDVINDGDGGGDPAYSAQVADRFSAALATAIDRARIIGRRASETQDAKDKANALAEKLAELAQRTTEAPAGATSLPTTLPLLIAHAEAAAALDIVQSTRMDTSYVSGNIHQSLLANLATLESAASGVANDNGSNPASSAQRIDMFSIALQDTIARAKTIGGRTTETQDAKDKSNALAARLAELADK
jgi:hypothetical protein